MLKPFHWAYLRHKLVAAALTSSLVVCLSTLACADDGDQSEEAEQETIVKARNS